MNEFYSISNDLISGKSIKDGFGFVETNSGQPNFSIISDLFTKGHHNGKVLYIIRNAIPDYLVNAIANNFKYMVSKRGSHRNYDGFVAVEQIGASQFAKNGNSYIEECIKTEFDLHTLFENLPQEAADAIFLESYLENAFLIQSIHFGPARYKHGRANIATFRRWLDNGPMALLPHEDIAQLASSKEDGFEISKVKIVVAYNVCFEATGSGGELTIWNIQPDNLCREKLGVVNTGYPYQLELINHIEKISVRLNPGDIYFMNGGYLHGVNSIIQGSRITGGRFIGKLPNNKVVYWT